MGPEVGSDVDSVARQALSGKETLSAGVDRFDRSMRELLAREIIRLRANLPEGYEAFLGQEIDQCVFAAWESQAPVLILDVWTLSRDGTLSVKRHLPGKGYPDTVKLGMHETIDRYLRLGTPFSDKPLNLSDLLTCWVELEIQTESVFPSPKVGPPISVLQIDASGAHWNRPGMCEQSNRR